MIGDLIIGVIAATMWVVGLISLMILVHESRIK